MEAKARASCRDSATGPAGVGERLCPEEEAGLRPGCWGAGWTYCAGVSHCCRQPSFTCVPPLPNQPCWGQTQEPCLVQLWCPGF